MKLILSVCVLGTLYLLVSNRIDEQYKKGYQDGVKEALKTNPVSEELELTCAGLWVGEQTKKYLAKEKRK
jgi:hypothetical protein